MFQLVPSNGENLTPVPTPTSLGFRSGVLIPIQRIISAAESRVEMQRNWNLKPRDLRPDKMRVASQSLLKHSTLRQPLKEALLNQQLKWNLRFQTLNQMTSSISHPAFDIKTEKHQQALNFKGFFELFSQEQELEAFLKTIRHPHMHIMACCAVGETRLIHIFSRIQPDLFIKEGPFYLIKAAQNGQLKTLNAMLAIDPPIRYLEKNIRSETALHALCNLIEEELSDEDEKEWRTAVNILIHRGCSITENNEERNNAALIALHQGNAKMVEFLLHHPSVNDKSALLQDLRQGFQAKLLELQDIGAADELASILGIEPESTSC